MCQIASDVLQPCLRYKMYRVSLCVVVVTVDWGCLWDRAAVLGDTVRGKPCGGQGARSMKNWVFWNETPCSLLQGGHRSFRGAVNSVVREDSQDGGSAFVWITGTAVGESLAAWRLATGHKGGAWVLRKLSVKSKAVIAHWFQPSNCCTTHTASHARNKNSVTVVTKLFVRTI